MPVVRFNGKKLDPATIKALVAGTLVNGSKPSIWWNRQSIDFRNSFMDTIRTSMRNGESLVQAATRVNGGIIDGVTVPGIMKTTKAKATALAATSMNAVANEAALKSFQANNDVIKAVSQVSTLDNKTSDICIAYSGQTWDINTLQPVMGGSLPFNGGPPRHFNCRSRLRPVTMSFKELGVDADEIPAGTRASMDGQVPSDITFNQFLKKKPTSFQNDLLGPKRAQLWRDDKITLTQLVDMRGNPMTIAQLEQKIGIKPKVDPLKKAAPAKKLTPPKEIFDDAAKAGLDDAVANAKVQIKVLEKEAADEAAQSAIQTFNNKIAANIAEGDLEFARHRISISGSIPEKVKASALKRIADVEAKATKEADRIFKNHKIGESTSRNDFNGRVADALLLDLEENAAARKIFIRKARVLKEAKEEDWAVAGLRELLDAGDSLKAKNTMAGMDITNKPKLIKIAQEINKGEKQAKKIIQELTAAVDADDVKNMPQWSKLVKDKINVDDVPDWVRNDILNNNMFSILEKKVQYKPNFKIIDDLIAKGDLEDAKIFLSDVPKNAPGWVSRAARIEEAKKQAKALAEEAVANFQKGAHNLLKGDGIPVDIRNALDDQFKVMGKVSKGVLGETEKAVIRDMAAEFKVARSNAIATIKSINKSSKGVEAIGDFVNQIAPNIRSNSLFNAELKKVVKTAEKKAAAARKAVKDHLIQKTNIVATPEEFLVHESLINDALATVHKKLGPKQLQAKLLEIKAKIKAAKAPKVNVNDINVEVFVPDGTDWDIVVKSFLARNEVVELDEIAKLFLADAKSQSAKSKLWGMLPGRSEKEIRAMKEYIFKRTNPKKLPSGEAFDKGVSEILNMHASNKPHKEILARMDELLGKKLATSNDIVRFEQTITTRGRMKSLDELGIVAEGDALPSVQKIRTQLKRDGDPHNIPIPEASLDDIRTGARTWLYSSEDDWAGFVKQQKRNGQAHLRESSSIIRNADRIHGQNSFQISNAEWEAHFKNVDLDGWEIPLIRQYTGSLYQELNKPLFNGITEGKTIQGAQALNKALDKMPKHSGTVYRGIRPRGSMDYIDARYEVGKTVVERNFGSSATVESAAFQRDVTFVIKSRGKSGAIIGPISKFGAGEMEVLWKAGTKFKVLKKTRRGNSMRIWLEEI